MRVVFLFWIVLTSNALLFSQTREECLTCHSDKELTTERNGSQHSLFVDEHILNKSSHQKLVCIACHTKFDPNNIPHKEKILPVNCLTCHNGVETKHTFHPQLVRAIRNKETSDILCKDCHGTHDVVSPKVSGSKFSREKLVESCGECHSNVTEKFAVSSHGMAFEKNVQGAPNCISCHRNGIASVDEQHDSFAVKISQEKLCLSCHLDNPDVRTRTSPTAGFISSYDKSVHGIALQHGNKNVASCINCHGSHEMKKAIEPTSFVNKKNIPQTCGQCHRGIAEEFNQSVHGIALAKGVNESPSCTQCHGEHNILSHNDPRSPVAPLNISGQVCSPCHSSLKLSQKYGIESDRFKTFSDSYHGLAIRGGQAEVANCASCHGVHNIKSSSDSTSTIHKKNIAATCGKCHSGANERFGMGAIHIVATTDEEPILYWIATIYIIMIVTVVGGMFVHNGTDFLKKSKRKFLIRRGQIIEEHVGHALYVRMTLNERLQHGSLALSFILLVITGFMLRYPDAWWVQSIRDLSADIFDWRSFIHRISAVVMVTASVWHIGYVSFTIKGRKLIADLVPNIQDVLDAIAVMKFNCGISPTKPQFGRFSYIEKSEYWALVWGTIVMAVTGVVMWFDNTFIGIITKLGYDISRTIHFYEAWLATLAIIVWHFYFIIFNPDVYPMNVAWWKGTISESEMQEEHPLELEKMKESK
ncbi:MAG: DUF4405 domain-containing protein [Ignavibacteria bacterium]|nr:DUF4405 domain-containing protein [Ignavibacteria bacterium]